MESTVTYDRENKRITPGRIQLRSGVTTEQRRLQGKKEGEAERKEDRCFGGTEGCDGGVHVESAPLVLPRRRCHPLRNRDMPFLQGLRNRSRLYLLSGLSFSL
jgi:hypothetical protein